MRTLPFPHISHYPLILYVLEALRSFPSAFPSRGMLEGVFVIRLERFSLPSWARFARGRTRFLFRLHLDEWDETVWLLHVLVVRQLLDFPFIFIVTMIVDVNTFRLVVRWETPWVTTKNVIMTILLLYGYWEVFLVWISEVHQSGWGVLSVIRRRRRTLRFKHFHNCHWTLLILQSPTNTQLAASLHPENLRRPTQANQMQFQRVPSPLVESSSFTFFVSVAPRLSLFSFLDGAGGLPWRNGFSWNPRKCESMKEDAPATGSLGFETVFFVEHKREVDDGSVVVCDWNDEVRCCV